MTAPRPNRIRALPACLRAVLVVLLVCFAPGCTLDEGSHFSVSYGTGVYVTIHRGPSAFITYGHIVNCRSDPSCTLAAMRRLVRFSWASSNPAIDLDYFLDPSQAGDFAEAVRDLGGVNRGRCLVLHRNLNPVGDRHNWTWREPGGTCRP